MDNKDLIEELLKLNKYVEILRNPDDFFHHMNGHITELSFVLASFEVSTNTEQIIDALKKQIAIRAKEDNFCLLCDMYLKDDNGVEGEYCPNCGQRYTWDDNNLQYADQDGLESALAPAT